MAGPLILARSSLDAILASTTAALLIVDIAALAAGPAGEPPLVIISTDWLQPENDDLLELHEEMIERAVAECGRGLADSLQPQTQVTRGDDGFLIIYLKNVVFNSGS